MTLEEIHTTVSTHRKKLTNSIKITLKYKLNVVQENDDLEDLVGDATLILLEKLHSGTKQLDDFSNAGKVLNYICVTACRKLKDNANKLRVSKKKYSEEEYIQEYQSDNSSEPEISTSEVYKNVMDYAYQNHDYIDVGVFKTKALNDLTYSQLEEVTGYNRNKVYYTVRTIREDIKKNKHIIFRPNP